MATKDRHDQIERALTGRASAPPDPRRLQAGSLTLELDGADLRHASHQGIEVLQQLYFAVRDVSWNTLPGTLRDVRVAKGSGPRFEVTFESHHRFPAASIDLSCSCRIEGTEAGELSYSIDVTTRTPIDYNRIGLNLLHGARTYAARPYRAWLGSAETSGVLPSAVGPVALDGERLTGLFPAFDHLQLVPVDGVTIDIRLEGDEFEAEDQRNYGDSSFKTYSTPLQRPGPFRLEPGEHLRQQATISVVDSRPDRSRATADEKRRALTVTLGAPSGAVVPPIGLGATSDGGPLTAAELERARALQPHHVRVELNLAEGESRCLERLAAAGVEARALGCGVWADLVATAAESLDLRAVAHSMTTSAPELQVLFLATPFMEPPDQGQSGRMLGEVREAVAESDSEIDVGVGSHLFFADINRAPFDGATTGRLSYPTSPTGHRVDDVTVVENMDEQGAPVSTARAHLGQRPLAVGPITLAYRHGPFPAGPSSAGDLPPQVDVRQRSLLGAAITASYLAELSRAGADSLTFFELAGWLGVAERDSGPPRPDAFPSDPGEVFPLWHVLADAAELRGADVVATRTEPAPVFTSPIAVLATRDAEGLHLIVASLRRAPLKVIVASLDDTSATVRTLDASTVESARRDPAAFRAARVSAPVVGGQLELALESYAVVRVDAR